METTCYDLQYLINKKEIDALGLPGVVCSLLEKDAKEFMEKDCGEYEVLVMVRKQPVTRVKKEDKEG